MSNLCWNELAILGCDIATVKQCLKTIRNEREVIDFAKIVPEPPILSTDASEEEKLAQTGSRTLLDWRAGEFDHERDVFVSQGHWGTSGNASGSKLIYYKEYRALISYWTSGCSPVPVLVALSKLFPFLELTAIYTESGAGECGMMILANGTFLRRHSRTV